MIEAQMNLTLFSHALSVFLLNLASYMFFFTKIFKVMCYSRMTFDWFPMLNPYIWPFSIFHTFTDPYFRFWTRVLPNLNFDKTSFDISTIIALEAINSVSFCFTRLILFLGYYLNGF
jgi:uncharacterized protein YggT (Ycf19 family)